MNHNMTRQAGPDNTVKGHFMSNFEARSTLLLAAMVLSAAGAAHAQTAAPSAASPNSPPSTMSPSAAPQADAATPSTGSSAIPRNKVTSKDLDGIFLKADTSKDGKLDRKETESLPAVAQNFDQLDSNRDGFISRAEFSKVAGT